MCEGNGTSIVARVHARLLFPSHLVLASPSAAKSREEARRVARELVYFFVFVCVCVAHTTQRHFYLEEAATVSQGKGQNPSAIKTYSEFANLKREPSSTNFVILSVIISSSR